MPAALLATLLTSSILLVTPAWAGGRHHGHGGVSVGVGLNFGFPLYPGGYYAPAPAPVIVQAPQTVVRQAPADCSPVREYQTEVMIGGKSVPAWGTACMEADGSRRVLSGPFEEQ